MNAMTEFPPATDRDLAENMEVIGRLSGGIAHDFNNLLTGILLYCDLLIAGLENETPQNNELERDNHHRNHDRPSMPPAMGLQRLELRQHVEEIRLASEQGAALTQQLLSIARKHVPQPEPVQFNEIVASTENLLRRLIGEHIEFVVELDPALNRLTNCIAGFVLADAAQLRQVLLNLVLNARDAVRHGGQIRMTTQACTFPLATTYLDPKLSPSVARPAVSLIVQDNGCGMDASTRARLFDPFFTSKKDGEGTGLGMATVQRIVTESHGAIEIESEPSRGTRIQVFLPLFIPVFIPLIEASP
jgi:two-component system cell cycle sensor histidine kinase/response regulator CckA